MDEITEKQTAMNEKFAKAVTIDEQAERSTFMDEMRAEVLDLYNDIARLTTKAEELQAKNAKLVEANSMLFSKVGYTKEDPTQKQKKADGLDLSGII
jgi:hypothetical protein